MPRVTRSVASLWLGEVIVRIIAHRKDNGCQVAGVQAMHANRAPEGKMVALVGAPKAGMKDLPL